MAAQGDDVPPGTEQHAKFTAKQPPKAAQKPQLSRVTNYLEDATRIGTFYVNHPRHRRYVDLNKQELFNSLVDLYTIVFKTYWNHFRRFVETFPLPATYAEQPQRFAAATYISAWFYDLYVSNRKACEKLSDSAYIEHYYLDLVHKSNDYDIYLTLLNAQIRPTNVKLTHEDTLYIPRISANLNQNLGQENYFDITGWTLDESLLHGLIYGFKDRKLLHMEALSETTLGRPSWLFDWHEDSLCYAWFPTESNYTFDDVSIAYIIGVACTPKLAPRDHDEWQLLPGNTIPANTAGIQRRRIRSVAYHAAVEIHRIEMRNHVLPRNMRDLIEIGVEAIQQPAPTATQQAGKDATNKGKGPQAKRPKITQTYQLRSQISGTSALNPTNEGEEEGEDETSSIPEEGQILTSDDPVPDPSTLVGQAENTRFTVQVPTYRQYRIVTYLYHARVVNYIDLSTRVAALRQFIFQSK